VLGEQSLGGRPCYFAQGRGNRGQDQDDLAAARPRRRIAKPDGAACCGSCRRQRQSADATIR